MVGCVQGIDVRRVYGLEEVGVSRYFSVGAEGISPFHGATWVGPSHPWATPKLSCLALGAACQRLPLPGSDAALGGAV